VETGADLEARRDGLTGLHLACAGGEADAAAEWVRAGADIGARSPGRATPLMLGATWPGIVRTLLKNGAEANAVDDDGHSALVYSILRQCWIDAQRQLDALQVLLDAGADVNLRDCAGVSPSGHARKVLAAALLDEEVIRAFEPAARPTTDLEWTPRKMAEAIVALLAARGANE
jgi:ankyrin repeat protein